LPRRILKQRAGLVGNEEVFVFGDDHGEVLHRKILTRVEKSSVALVFLILRSFSFSSVTANGAIPPLRSEGGLGVTNKRMADMVRVEIK